MSNYLINAFNTAHYTAGAVCVVQRASQRPAAGCAALHLLQHDAQWSIMMNIYAQVGLTVGI